MHQVVRPSGHDTAPGMPSKGLGYPAVHGAQNELGKRVYKQACTEKYTQMPRSTSIVNAKKNHVLSDNPKSNWA